MHTLTDGGEIRDAQRRIEDAVASAATDTRETVIGHPQQSISAWVYWLANHNLWAHFRMPPMQGDSPTRYWNAFGIGEPRKSVNIACEINPPLEGINRQASGVFASDGSTTHLLHRGNVNVVRGRVPRAVLRDQFRGRWEEVQDDGKPASMMHVGDLGVDSFVDSLAAFVMEIGRIKDNFRGRK